MLVISAVPKSTQVDVTRDRVYRMKMLLNTALKKRIREIQRESEKLGIKLPDCHFAGRLGVSAAVISYVLNKEAPMTIDNYVACLALLGYEVTLSVSTTTKIEG